MTNNKQQTAVEWLFYELERIDKVYYRNTIIYTDARKEAFEQAKEMEEEKMIEFAYDALKIADNTTNRYVDVDKLYKELYGGNK